MFILYYKSQTCSVTSAMKFLWLDRSIIWEVISYYLWPHFYFWFIFTALHRVVQIWLINLHVLIWKKLIDSSLEACVKMISYLVWLRVLHVHYALDHTRKSRLWSYTLIKVVIIHVNQGCDHTRKSRLWSYT